MKDNSQLITFALLGVGGYALYWYITNYGPTGPVLNAAGVKTSPSYWDGWFGASTPAVSATTQPAANPTTVTTTSTNGTTTTTPIGTTATQTGPQWPNAPITQANSAQVIAWLQNAANGNQFLVNNQMNADQWNYFLNSISAFPLQSFDQIFFPNGRPSDPSQYPVYTAGAFVQKVIASGLSGIGDIIRVPAGGGLGNAFSGRRPLPTAFKTKGWIQ